jgi:hypothetical protein
MRNENLEENLRITGVINIIAVELFACAANPNRN